MDDELERFSGEIGYDRNAIVDGGNSDDDPIHWREVLDILADGRETELEKLSVLPAVDIFKKIILKAKQNRRLLKAVKKPTGGDLEYLRDYLQ